MKKLFSLILALTVLLSAFSSGTVYVSAADGETVESETFTHNVKEGLDLKYTVTDGEITITGCTKGYSDKVEVPAEINGLPVKAIAEGAFKNQSSITKVTLKKGIEVIGNQAFYNCKAMQRVTLPETIKSIGESAFYNCSVLKYVIIRDGVTVISRKLFYGCEKLEKISLPDFIERIESYAFQEVKLEFIQLPKKLKYIGSDAFSNSSIEKLKVDSMEHWCEIEFGDMEANPMFFSDTVEINNKTSSEVVVPEGITVLNKYVFAKNKFETITLPRTLKEIKRYAFYNSSSTLKTIKYNGTKTEYEKINIATSGNGAISEDKWKFSFLSGDFNGDDNIDVLDFIVLKKIISGTMQSEGASADVNADNLVNTDDLVLTVKYLLGIEDKLFGGIDPLPTA